MHVASKISIWGVALRSAALCWICMLQNMLSCLALRCVALRKAALLADALCAAALPGFAFCWEWIKWIGCSKFDILSRPRCLMSRSRTTRRNRQRIVRIISCSFSCNYVLFRKEGRKEYHPGRKRIANRRQHKRRFWKHSIQKFVIIIMSVVYQ